MSTTKSLPITPRLKPLKGSSGIDASSVSKRFSTVRSSHGEIFTEKTRPVKRTAVSKATELRQVQEELARTRELLGLMEKSKLNLMQDLARAKKTVEQLTAKRNDAKKASSGDTVCNALLEDDGPKAELHAIKSKYEAALSELDANKQIVESLRHELIVCVEEKYEAVRLAGEAMNAAEASSRRVARVSQRNMPGPQVIYSSGMEPDESTDEFYLTATHERLLRSDDICDKALQQEDESILSESHIEASENEIIGDSSADASFRGNYKLTGLKETTNRAFSQPIQIHTASALEEAQEKLLGFILAEAVLVSSLEYLKIQLEKNRQDAEEARKGEVFVNHRLEELNRCLMRIKERNEEEMRMLKQKEASAYSSIIEGLKAELESQKSALIMTAAREEVASSNADALSKELEARKHELAENRMIDQELERTREELQIRKKRECEDSVRIASLMSDVEAKRVEMADLQERLSEINGKLEAMSVATLSQNNDVSLLNELRAREMQANATIVALKSDVFGLKDALEETRTNNQNALEDLLSQKEKIAVTISSLKDDLIVKRSETVKLQEIISDIEHKFMILCITLSTLSRNHEIKLLEGNEREANANAKIAAVKAEVSELKITLEEALRTSNMIREDLRDSQASLENAVSEAEKFRKEADDAAKEAEFYKQLATDASTKIEACKGDAIRAVEAAKAVEVKALDTVKRAMEAAQVARKEEEVARELLQVTMKDAEIARMQAEMAKQETQLARKELGLMKEWMIKEKQELEGVLDKTEESEKLKRITCVLCNMVFAEQGSESNGARNTSNKEDIGSLRSRLEACEGLLEVTMAEAESLRIKNTQLSMDLEAADAEVEENKRAVLEANQSLVQMEKAKSVLEADIQKLLDESKRRNACKETKDIPVHSLDVSQQLCLDSRQEKPQPDSPQSDDMDTSIAMPHPQENMVEEMAVPSETPVTPHGLSVKKKKNALLHKLQNYLDKKKNIHGF